MTVVLEYQTNPDQPLLLPTDFLAAMSTELYQPLHRGVLEDVFSAGVHDTLSFSDLAIACLFPPRKTIVASAFLRSDLGIFTDGF